MIAVALQRAGQAPERTAYVASLLIPVATADLPPLAAISRNGRPSVLYLFASLIFYQYLRAVAVACCVGQGYAACVDYYSILTAINPALINNTL